MQNRPDLSIEHLLGTSALLNGVAIPGRSLESTLGRYAFNVFVGNDDETFPVSLRGTGTALKFGDKSLFVCSQHQLAGVERQRVGMMAEGGGKFVTSGGMRYFDPKPDTDANDLVAFDFTEPVAALPQFAPRFFNLKWQRTGAEPIGFLLTGCPFSDQNYDVADSNHIGLARRQVLCNLDANTPADTALFRVIPREPLTFDPDGMSGGSAFAVVSGAEGFEIGFAGIIVRGGATGFHVIKGGVVVSFLETISDWGRRKSP